MYDSGLASTSFYHANDRSKQPDRSMMLRQKLSKRIREKCNIDYVTKRTSSTFPRGINELGYLETYTCQQSQSADVSHYWSEVSFMKRYDQTRSHLESISYLLAVTTNFWSFYIAFGVPANSKKTVWMPVLFSKK